MVAVRMSEGGPERERADRPGLADVLVWASVPAISG